MRDDRRVACIEKTLEFLLVQKSVQVQTHAKYLMTIHVTSFVTKQFWACVASHIFRVFFWFMDHHMQLHHGTFPLCKRVKGLICCILYPSISFTIVWQGMARAIQSRQYGTKDIPFFLSIYISTQIPMRRGKADLMQKPKLSLQISLFLLYK